MSETTNEDRAAAQQIAQQVLGTAGLLGSIPRLHVDEDFRQLVGIELCRALAASPDCGIFFLDQIVAAGLNRIAPIGNHAVVYIDPEVCDNDIAHGIDPEIGVYVIDSRDSSQQARSSEAFETPEQVGAAITEFLRKRAKL